MSIALPSVQTVREEYGLKHLPIVSNMDFDHTEPVFVLPLGMKVRIDSTPARNQH